MLITLKTSLMMVTIPSLISKVSSAITDSQSVFTNQEKADDLIKQCDCQWWLRINWEAKKKTYSLLSNFIKAKNNLFFY